MNSAIRGRLPLIVAFVLLAWLVFYCFHTASLIVNAYNPLPVMDYWELVPHLDGYRHFPPAVFWEQHYEHRVIVPELVFACDWLFLKGREILPMVLTSLLDVAVWIVFVRAYRASSNRMSALTWSALLLAGIVMAWPGVAFVLAFPFSLQFLMLQFAATASLWCLSQGKVNQAISLGIVATFSSANGLFLWPALVLLGWSIGLRPARSIKILCAGALATALFFYGYRNLGNTHPELVFSQTKTLFGYFLMYLGMPFGAAGNAVGLVAGAASLFMLAFLAVVAWRGKQTHAPVFVVCFGVGLLTVVTALITAASRLPLDGRPFEQAILTPGRYVNFAAHYWAALILLLVWTIDRNRPKLAWASLLGLTAMMAATLFRTDAWINTWMASYAGYQYATLAIESGLTTNEIGRVLNYSDGSLVQRSIVELERRQLSAFSWDRYKLVGKPLTSSPGRFGAELPQAQVTAVQPIAGGFRMVGWADPKSYLAVVDRSGLIAGLGRHPPAGEVPGIPIPPGHAQDYWVAFAGPSFQREGSRLVVLTN